MIRRVSGKQKQIHAMWLNRLSEWEQSGLSQSKYCKDNNFNLRNFQYWKRKFKLLNNPEVPQKHTEVKVVQLKNESIASERINFLNNPNPISLIVNNIKVELKNNFSEEALRKLIKVLKTV
jgi:hypothetical protein